MEGWKDIAFGEIADFKNGINFEKSQKCSSGIPTLDVKNMFGNSCYVNTSELYCVNKKLDKDYFLKDGDLLFVRSSLKEEGVGWTSLYGGKDDVVTFCGFIIRARLFKELRNDFDTEFLTYFFRTEVLRKELVSGSGRVAITNINQGLLKSIKVPKPSFEEQQKIASILNKVQGAIEKQEAIIRTTTEIKKALLQKLFTEGLHGEPQKETEIGPVPESWDVVEIKEMYDFTSKPRGLEISTPVSFIPMELVPLNQIFISSYEMRDKVSSGTYVENGDLLLAKITPSFENGKQGIVSIDKDYSYATTEVIPIKEVKNTSDKFYLFYYLLKDDVRKQLADKMEGSTGRQRLSKTILENTLIPKPHLKEQKEIASVFVSIDKKLSFHQSKKQALANIFKTLLHQLMTGQLRVNEIEFEQEEFNEALPLAAEPEAAYGTG